MLQDGNRLYKVAGTSHGSVRKINVRILFSPLLTGSQILESFSNITHWSIECPILLFQANVSPLQMVLGGLSELCTFDQLGQRFAAVQRFFLTNLRTPSPHSASVMNDPASWAILIPLLLLLWLWLLLLWSWDVWHPLTKAKKAKRKAEARAWTLGTTQGLVWDEEPSPFVKRMYPAKIGREVCY